MYKRDNDTETNSHIRRLTDEERVEELAHMLSGATLTEAALSNARALLEPSLEKKKKNKISIWWCTISDNELYVLKCRQLHD